MALQNFHYAFPLLSALGVYTLWIFMYQNGSIDAQGEVVAKQIFPDGTPLKTSYTGLAPFDQLLTTLVAFTYYATEGKDRASWLLITDIFSTLQTGVLWTLMDSARAGRATILLAIPALWPFLWNVVGGAVVLPIYVFIQLRNPPSKQNIPPEEAKALSPSVILGSFVPVLAMLSAPFIPRSVTRHQNIVALVQCTPLIVTALQYLGATTFRSYQGRDVRRSRDSVPAVRQALLFAGTFSALAHLFVLYQALSTQGLFRSIYMPLSNQTVASAGTSQVALGSFLFLQYDCLIINLTAVLWSYALVVEHVAGLASSWGFVAGLVLADYVLGPGATVSAALWWREARINPRVTDRNR